ncbi:MAG: hypothetical protein RIR11_51 [Bacteroidota bacterium]
MLQLLSNKYDQYMTPVNIRKVERWTIMMALGGFLLHLLLIFLLRNIPNMLPGLAIVSPNYLKAIFTPFSFVLFFEVFMLVVILPRSISVFIGKQFEIMTLITLRSFFHDIAEYDLTKTEIYSFQFLKETGMDIGGALVMFFLTLVFFFILQKKPKSGTSSQDRTKFINLKKSLSVILSVVLLLLSLQSFVMWGINNLHALQTGIESHDPNHVFYQDFFNIMIFVDVLLLIVSLIYSGTYEVIFRNACFIILTILIRIAITAPKPYNIVFALGAMLLGVLTMMLFVLFVRLKKEDI